MKGIVLAGGTATRLFPLTIVTNKHLLPIYDRPMIYYPIETLAGMGIREVMVVVGGKSVGDVVELLADGSPLRAGPDLPLPARARSGSPTPSASPATSSATTRSAVVLGDNILRGAAARPASPRDVRGGPVRRRHAALPGPRPGAVRRRRVRRGRAGRRLRGEAGRAQERPHPDRRLLPAPGRLRRHRAPGPVRPRRVRDHRRPQPLHPGRRPVHPRLRRPLDRRRHGAVAPAGRRAGGRRRRRGSPGAARRPAGRRDRSLTDRAFGRLLVTGGAGFIGSLLRPRRPGPPRRHAGSRSSTS